jgi:hypothetical protein
VTGWQRVPSLGWVAAGATVRPGDWTVVHSTSAVGRLIYDMERLSGGHGDYEHAAYHCCEINGVKMISEMMPGGCQHVPLHYPAGSMAWSSGVIVKSDRARELSCAAAHRSGDDHLDYSFLDYAAMAARAWHIPAPGLAAYIRATGHLICSAAVAWWELQGGTKLWPGRWTGYDRPIDLSMLLDAPAPLEVAA